MNGIQTVRSCDREDRDFLWLGYRQSASIKTHLDNRTGHFTEITLTIKISLGLVCADEISKLVLFFIYTTLLSQVSRFLVSREVVLDDLC